MHRAGHPGHVDPSVDHRNLYYVNLITKGQVERYHLYKIDRQDENKSNIEEMFQLITPREKKLFLYQLKSLLNN